MCRVWVACRGKDASPVVPRMRRREWSPETRQLPTLAARDDAVRRFIALVDECYDRRIPLYIEAEVALDELYTEGYLAFPFRRTLSRLREMQLQRFGHGHLSQSR